MSLFDNFIRSCAEDCVNARTYSNDPARIAAEIREMGEIGERLMDNLHELILESEGAAPAEKILYPLVRLRLVDPYTDEPTGLGRAVDLALLGAIR